MKNKNLMILLLVLAGLFGCFWEAAEAETMVVLGRAEDAASFASVWDSSADAKVLVLQKCNDKAQKNVRDVLSEADLKDVTFLNFTSIRESKLSEKVLEKNWVTANNTSKIASLLRRQETDQLVFYSEQDMIHTFLASYMQECVQSAWNPDIRIKGQKEDEYIWQVAEVRDGKTGQTEVNAFKDWKDTFQQVYGEKKEPVLELPLQTADGFLPDGEYLLSDEQEGVWAYVSDTLRIVITRYEIKGLRWYEADIRRKPEGDSLHVVESTNGKSVKPTKIALENQLVLGINGDYYKYRINYKMLVGLIVRNGKILHDFHQNTTGTSLPPLDTLMLNEQGMFQLDRAGIQDGESALSSGAKDVLAFGPILVKNGRIRMLLTKYRTKIEPRTAIGQIEPNHFLAVVVEGRAKASKGISLDHLAKLMYLRGCTEAINLDGGHTSVLIFMGKQLNKIGNLSGDGFSAPRNMFELLGIGTSAQVREVE